MMMSRIDGRANDQLRPVEIVPGINKFAEGSCLIRCGNTHVLCTASVEEKTPPHVPEGEGWVTAEYSMLPRANRERSRRDVSKLKLSPRSAEIQRLVGRALRSAVDMKKLGPRAITVDCDVLQGDGGTRTASVTGGFVAMVLAMRKLLEVGATTFALVHNHPSGNVSPSPEDRRLTGAVRDAAKLFNIHLVDHVIIGAGKYFSFSDECML